MDALEICVSGIIACFHQCLKACLHQSGYAAAKHSLFAEQVGLGLGTEGGFQNARTRAAYTQGISQGHIQRLAGGILLNGYQAGNTLAGFVFASYGVARALGGNHGHVHERRRIDQAEMDVEAMGEHKHVAFFQVGLDVSLIHGRLLLVIDEDHDDVCLFGSFICCKHFKALCLSLGPGFASLVQTDDDVASGILQVQRMGMALAAVADNRDGFAFQQGKVAVFLVVNLC